MQLDEEVQKAIKAKSIKIDNSVQVAFDNSSSKYSISSDWFTFENDLHIHRTLFKNGIISIVPASDEDKWLHEINEHSIHLYSQSNDTGDEQQNTPTLVKRRVLTFNFSKLAAKTPVDSLTFKHPSEFRKCNKLLSQLAQFGNRKEKDAFRKSADEQDQFFIFNPDRRDEIFLPISINQMGLYLYPWLSKEKSDWNFSGFDQFATVGCLFGSSLKGRNNKGTLYPFIKHERHFFNGEHITSIVYNSHKQGPYEETLFFELEKWCSLINILSDTSANKSKKLYFHLPDYDYVLFGIELYLRGRITYKALDDFIKIIFDKKEQYLQKIRNLGHKYNITIITLSPFENLFGNQIKRDNLTKVVFETLELQYSPLLGKVDEITQKENESRFVRICLNKLLNNSFNHEHREVWFDFLKSHISINDQNNSVESILKIVSQSINTIEDLFKIANAVVIGIASKGKTEYKTCSLLPLSEKQIQISYCKYAKKSILQSKYPPIFNATILDSLLTYSGATNGPLFYFDTEEMKLLEQLIRNFDLLRIASNNIHLMLLEKSQKELETILSSYISPLSESPPSISSSPENLIELQFRQGDRTSKTLVLNTTSETTHLRDTHLSEVDNNLFFRSPSHSTYHLLTNPLSHFLTDNKISFFSESSNHEYQKTNIIKKGVFDASASTDVYPSIITSTNTKALS